MNFFSSCDIIDKKVREITGPLIGTKEGGETVQMGADNTPTKRIDKVAEDCIIGYLKKFNLCQILVSEEAGRVTFDNGRGTIFLDPIDGTYNAIADIPFYALSIAYAENGIITKGYVANLATNEVFTAELGRGAFQNGRQISVSNVSDPGSSAISIYGTKNEPERVIELIKKARRVRQLGASALEISYVAAGKLDAFIDLRSTLRVTDAAAGVLICQEAGGIVSDKNGEQVLFPEDVTIGTSLVASNGHLHRSIITPR